MVFLPLLLIWLRDPMYFNAPSRWSVVVLAISIALLDARRTPTPSLADPPAKCLNAALPEHRWLHTFHREVRELEAAGNSFGELSDVAS